VFFVHGRARVAASDEQHCGNCERKAASMRLSLVGRGTDRDRADRHGKPRWVLDLLSIRAFGPDDSAPARPDGG
jgi:hypothetical protein